MSFESAQQNFLVGAREGLGANLRWVQGEEQPAIRLVLETLLPLAHAGLEKGGILAADREKYLGIIEARVRAGRTGARWQLQSLAGMREKGTQSERLAALTAAMLARQRTNQPVAEWQPALLGDAGGWKRNYTKVEQYMTTDVLSVHEDDPVELAANLMEWQRIRHVPVEDREHKLVGIVTYRGVLRALVQAGQYESPQAVAVGEVMKRDPISVAPDLHTLKVIAIMRQFGIGCPPVVHDGKLVAIVTEHDFMDIAGQLLEQKLTEE